MSDNKKKSEPTSAEEMRRLMDLTEIATTPFVDELYVTKGEKTFLLREGKVISGRFDRNIRIDTANYGAGKKHAHIHGRKGNELGIVNVDGTPSHGMKCRLHPDDITALCAQGFKIPDNGIVEWVSLGITGFRFLIEG
jgi:hypothetical protein